MNEYLIFLLLLAFGTDYDIKTGSFYCVVTILSHLFFFVFFDERLIINNNFSNHNTYLNYEKVIILFVFWYSYYEHSCSV